MQAALAAALSLGCGEKSSVPLQSTSPDAIIGLKVTLPSTSMMVGTSGRATVVTVDRGGNHVAPTGTVTWQAGAPEVATISSEGVITAVGPGQTPISATFGAFQEVALLTVVPVPATRIALSRDTATLAVGEALDLQAMLFDSTGRELAGRSVQWSSSDPAKVSVTPGGRATALALGRVRVTATAGQLSTTALVLVKGPPGVVAAVFVEPAINTVVIGDSVHLSAFLEDSDGEAVTGRRLQWILSSSGGSGIGTLSDSGVFVALRPGRVIVEAVADNQRGQAMITVVDQIDRSIVVKVASPLEGEVIEDSLVVKADVKPTQNVRTVILRVLNDSTLMRLEPINSRGTLLWVGRLDLSAVRYGNYQLIVTVLTTDGKKGLGTLTFTRATQVGPGGTKPPPRNR